jgi:DNA-directed RNA polymerase subunit L
MTKITINNISWDKEPMNTRLEFDIEGDSISHTIVNTLRRIVLSVIPIYAFTDIKISKNTSVFNNNYMKLRINNLPVFGIYADNPIYIPKIKTDVIKEDIELDDIEMESKQDDINSSSLKLLTMYVDYVNNTNEIITVGTNDCKFYYAQKHINSPYSTNIPIIKLQPKQQFKMSAITELGIEESSSIYSAVSIFTYKMLSDTKYRVILESRGQLDEKMILQYTFDNIKMILTNFLELIPDKTDISGKLLMNNADHTIGNLISEGLQKHPKIKFGGYNAPHLLDKKIIFHYELKEANNIKTIMKDIVEDYLDIFTQINKLVQKDIN